MKSKFFENVDRNRNFSKILTEIKIFGILTEIEIFEILDRYCNFSKILTEIEIFEILDQN